MSGTSITLNMQCSRCPRVDRVEINLEEATRMAQKIGQVQEPAVVVSLNGKKYGSFQNLCSVCTQIVSAHLDAAFKKLEKMSSHKVKTGKGSE